MQRSISQLDGLCTGYVLPGARKIVQGRAAVQEHCSHCGICNGACPVLRYLKTKDLSII